MIPLTLSHRILGQLVGARRPTVSSAIGELAARDELVRREDGTWLLKGEPVGVPTGDAALDPDPAAAVRPGAPEAARPGETPEPCSSAGSASRPRLRRRAVADLERRRACADQRRPASPRPSVGRGPEPAPAVGDHDLDLALLDVDLDPHLAARVVIAVHDGVRTASPTASPIAASTRLEAPRSAANRRTRPRIPATSSAVTWPVIVRYGTATLPPRSPPAPSRIGPVGDVAERSLRLADDPEALVLADTRRIRPVCRARRGSSASRRGRLVLGQGELDDLGAAEPPALHTKGTRPSRALRPLSMPSLTSRNGVSLSATCSSADSTDPAWSAQVLARPWAG